MKINLGSLLFWWPLCFIMILVLSCLTVKRWCLVTEQIQHEVDSEAQESFGKALTEIKKIATLLPPLGSSSTNLARLIGSYLGGSELSFQSIQIKVAPVLFLALSTIPYLSQVSYIGPDGLLLSYHGDKDHAFATYSNASSSSVWYTQPVDLRTGQPFGQVVTTQSMFSVNDSWFQEALNDTRGYPLLGNAWNKNQGLLIHYVTAVNGRRGLVTATMPAKIVDDLFAPFSFQEGDFFLASADGKVIIPTSHPNTQVVIKDGTALVQTLQPNGHTKTQVAQVSCEPGNGKREFLKGNIARVEYVFHCSTIEIMGIQSVYVLSYPSPKLKSLADKGRNSFVVLLTSVLIYIGALSALLMLLAKAGKGETCSCTLLGQQTAATRGADCYAVKPQARQYI